tara:strand:+ start:540 stop:1253 length:714 start_codon:yes stop_codon:yes gene_type:complete
LIFKALLLAAGMGTRLRPLTNSIPKCLVKIGGKPILEIWLENLSKAGCEEVIINTHYLSEKVEEYLEGRKFGDMKIITTYEPKLLGTAGTLLKNANFLLGKNCMLIHADNFTDVNLEEFLKFHKDFSIPKKRLLTMMTFTTNNPESCGIVSINNEGIVENFHEKKSTDNGNIANAAIYCFNDNLINFLISKKKNFFDFSEDVIPECINNIQTFHTNSTFIDIGTIDNLELARRKYKN